MWIRTQNRQRIVNTDNIVEIFIDKTGTKILASTTRDPDFASSTLLGEYENRNSSILVIAGLIDKLNSKVKIILMPLGGEVDKWLD